MTDTRPCTCAPDERPYPCQHQYALGLCRKAEIRSLRADIDRLIAQVADLTKLRLEDGLVHGNVMGRIAIALFGGQNNCTDEECVARAAEIGYELDGAKTAVLRATGKEVAWREMADKRGERVSQLEHERDSWQALAAAADADKRKAEADLAAAQKTLNDHLLSEAAETMRADKATSELAAARAALDGIPRMILSPTYYGETEWGKAILAALAGQRREGEGE